jgi:Uri superfamily endonuclease
MANTPTQLESPRLPRHKGSYVLLLELALPETLTVGRLGPLDFAPGLYAYTGNAHGPGGLAARLGHHLKTAARCHWHIDYLRLRAPVVAVWADGGAADADQGECCLARRLGERLPFQPPYRGFGSSDCTCYSHLLHWKPPAGKSPPPASLRGEAIARMDAALSPLARLL